MFVCTPVQFSSSVATSANKMMSSVGGRLMLGQKPVPGASIAVAPLVLLVFVDSFIFLLMTILLLLLVFANINILYVYELELY